MPNPIPRIAVLISGNGSTLQALIDAKASLHATIHLVVSDKAHAYGLIRAQEAGIATAIVTPNKRMQYEHELLEVLEQYQIDFVILAGFMRILTDPIIERYHGRLINIHPSLLPKYRGLNTYERALADNETEHGTSIHFVTQELDAGPIIAQAKCAILPNDTPTSLQEKTQQLEQQLYPEVVAWLAKGWVKLGKSGVEFASPLEQNPYCYRPKLED